MKSTMHGLPDIIGILKNKPGVMFAIEVKSARGRVSDSQEKWLRALNLAGAIAFIATDLDTVINTLERAEKNG